MMDLHRYFRNPFTNPGISVDELVAFTADHLGLLGARAGTSLYDGLIASTAPLFDGLEGRITDQVVRESLRRARTTATQALRHELHASLSGLEGRVHSRFPRESATYLGIFPSGLSAFYNASVDGFGPLLDALMRNLEPHAAAIGEDDIAALTTLVGRWKTYRGEQLESKAGVSDAATLRRDAADALRAQLFDNLLTLARAFPDQPEAAKHFFTQSLLEDHPRSEPGEAAPGDD